LKFKNSKILEKMSQLMKLFIFEADECTREMRDELSADEDVQAPGQGNDNRMTDKSSTDKGVRSQISRGSSMWQRTLLSNDDAYDFNDGWLVHDDYDEGGGIGDAADTQGNEDLMEKWQSLTAIRNKLCRRLTDVEFKLVQLDRKRKEEYRKRRIVCSDDDSEVAAKTERNLCKTSISPTKRKRLVLGEELELCV